MQTVNVNLPVTVTARHMPLTDAIREYCQKKIAAMHLDYPKVVGAHFILAVDKHRQRAELVLHCANHITIEAHEVCDNLYACIDTAVSKAARQMRKYKTRLMKGFRPHRQNVRYLDEHLVDTSFLDQDGGANGNGKHEATIASPLAETSSPSAAAAEAPAEHHAAESSANAKIVSTEKYPARPMFVDEAVVQMDLWDREFLVFLNVATEQLNVLYRRRDGGIGLIQPEKAPAAAAA